jgi:hypothetical protein
MVNLPKLPLRIVKDRNWIYVEDADEWVLESVCHSTLRGWEVPDAQAIAERRMAEWTEMIEAATPKPRWTWKRRYDGPIIFKRDDGWVNYAPTDTTDEQAQDIVAILNRVVES